MGQRFVPITITVSGGQQGAAEVTKLSNAFNQLDNSAGRTSNGGMQNAFNATQLMRSEFQSLGSQIPIVGRLFNGLSSDMIRHVSAGRQVTEQVKQQKAAYTEFVKFVGGISRGMATGESLNVLGTLGRFEVDQGTLRNSKAAFAGYLAEFQKIEDPAQRAALAVDQFGAKGAQLLPVLESMTAAEAATAGSTAAVGTSMLAVLGPIALVVAILAVLVGGLALGGKGLFDLTKLAADTGGEIYDLSTKLNFTAETLSTLKIAAITSGSSLEAISGALGIFDKNITLANESDTKLAKQFRDFNVDIRDNETALRSVFRALAALPDGAKQTELAMLAFGRSGKEVLGIVKDTNGDLDLAIKKYSQMGLVITTEAAKAADEFGDELSVVQLQLKMVGVAIGYQLMPYVKQLVDGLSRLVTEKGPEIQQWAHDTIESVKNVAEAVKGLNAVLNLSGLPSVDTSDTSGAFLMARIVSWSTGAGVVIEALRQIWNLMDKIGSYVRPKTAADTGGKIYEPLLDRGAKGGVDSLKDLAPSQQEEVNKLLAKSTQRAEESRNALATFSETTKYAAAQQQVLRDKLLEIPPALQKYGAEIQRRKDAADQEFLTNSKQLDQMKAEKKAADEAAKANETFANETASLGQRLADMAETGSKARTEIEKFQEALAGGKYKNVIAAELIERENLLVAMDARIEKTALQTQIDKYTKLREAVANSLETIGQTVDQAATRALSDKDQRMLELHATLEQTAKSIEGISALKIDRTQFAGIIELFKAGPEAVDATRALSDINTVLQSVAGDLGPEKLAAATQAIFNLLTGAAKADRDLLAAQTPLAQAQAQYNALLKDEASLHDPLLQKQIIANELLRDKIALEQRDLDATIAINRAQLELADATTYHATQANAKVLEFLARQKNVTEIIADAKIGVIQTTYDLIDRGLDKITSKLGAVGSLIKSILSDFIRLALSKVFQNLFGLSPGGGASQGSGGGGGSGGILNFIGGLFRGGANQQGQAAFQTPGGQSGSSFGLGSVFSGGGSPFGGGLSFGGATGSSSSGFNLAGLAGLGGGLGGGISAPTSTLSSQVAQSGTLSGLLHEAGHSAGPALGGASSFAGLGASLGAMAPLLGLTLGAQLGGSSRLGSVLGAAGGLLAGGIIGAFTGTGIFAAGGIAGAGGALSFLPALLTNPFTLLAAPLIIFAAIKLGQLAQRRKEETTRNQLSGDVYNDTIKILNAARSGQISYSEAMSQYGQVRTNYFAEIGKFKDSKTRQHATDWWNNDFDPFYRPLIEKAGKDSDEAKARVGKLQPEFASGGAVWPQIQSMRHLQFANGGAMSQFMGRVPGTYDRRDNHLIAVSGDEVVLTPQQWKPITRYLTAVRVPGFANGGAGANASPSIATNAAGDIVFNVSDDRLAALLAMIFDGMKSPDGRKITIKTVRSARVSGEL